MEDKTLSDILRDIDTEYNGGEYDLYNDRIVEY